MSQTISQTLKKLIPTFVLITLAYLAGGTSVFDDRVHAIASKAFTDFGTQLLPSAIYLLFSLIVLNIAWAFYHPLKETTQKAMVRAHASERAQLFGIKAMGLLYWVAAILIALIIVFPDVFSKLLLGASLLGAAITLALQGAANDFICGVLLQFTPKFKVEDEITIGGLALDGKDVTGKVTDISYLTTAIVTTSGIINVPNRELWSRAVKVIDPNYRAPDSVSTPKDALSSAA
jgi:small-conductance mechanosensitive channel